LTADNGACRIGLIAVGVDPICSEGKCKAGKYAPFSAKTALSENTHDLPANFIIAFVTVK
jgi:hypothetical protein